VDQRPRPRKSILRHALPGRLQGHPQGVEPTADLDERRRLPRPKEPKGPFQDPRIPLLRPLRHHQGDHLEDRNEPKERNSVCGQGQRASSSNDWPDGALQSIRAGLVTFSDFHTSS
jgi:hypothetical protein